MASKKPIKQQYDPLLSYQWLPEDKFEIMGVEFEYMFRYLSDYLNEPESRKVVRAYEVHKILEQKLKDGVEKGMITPSEKLRKYEQQ